MTVVSYDDSVWSIFSWCAVQLMIAYRTSGGEVSPNGQSCSLRALSHHGTLFNKCPKSSFRPLRSCHHECHILSIIFMGESWVVPIPSEFNLQHLFLAENLSWGLLTTQPTICLGTELIISTFNQWSYLSFEDTDSTILLNHQRLIHRCVKIGIMVACVTLSGEIIAFYLKQCRLQIRFHLMRFNSAFT